MGGAAVTGGQIATVMTARQLSFIPDTLAGGWTLVVKQALAAFGWTWLAARFLPGRWSPFVAAGAWAAPVQTAIRQSGVPVLSTGLGECDAGYGMIAGYAPASQPVLPSMQGYAPRSMPYTGAGDGQVGEYAPASFGNSTFGS